MREMYFSEMPDELQGGEPNGKQITPGVLASAFANLPTVTDDGKNLDISEDDGSPEVSESDAMDELLAEGDEVQLHDPEDPEVSESDAMDGPLPPF